jgi:hypothetical protein
MSQIPDLDPVRELSRIRHALDKSASIVESWGGKLEVRSSEGAGTAFTLLLPRA